MKRHSRRKGKRAYRKNEKSKLPLVLGAVGLSAVLIAFAVHSRNKSVASKPAARKKPAAARPRVSQTSGGQPAGQPAAVPQAQPAPSAPVGPQPVGPVEPRGGGEAGSVSFSSDAAKRARQTAVNQAVATCGLRGSYTIKDVAWLPSGEPDLSRMTFSGANNVDCLRQTFHDYAWIPAWDGLVSETWTMNFTV